MLKKNPIWQTIKFTILHQTRSKRMYIHREHNCVGQHVHANFSIYSFTHSLTALTSELTQFISSNSILLLNDIPMYSEREWEGRKKKIRFNPCIFCCPRTKFSSTVSDTIFWNGMAEIEEKLFQFVCVSVSVCVISFCLHASNCSRFATN